MRRWTEADVRRINASLQGQIQGATAGPTKYGNQRVEFNGRVFDSGRELKHFKDFKAQALMGAIRAVIPQVSLPLPDTSRRIRIDFLVIENDGKHVWYDSKGFADARWQLKAKMVRDAYGLEIHRL